MKTILARLFGSKEEIDLPGAGLHLVVYRWRGVLHVWSARQITKLTPLYDPKQFRSR